MHMKIAARELGRLASTLAALLEETRVRAPTADDFQDVTGEHPDSAITVQLRYELEPGTVATINDVIRSRDGFDPNEGAGRFLPIVEGLWSDRQDIVARTASTEAAVILEVDAASREGMSWKIQSVGAHNLSTVRYETPSIEIALTVLGSALQSECFVFYSDDGSDIAETLSGIRDEQKARAVKLMASDTTPPMAAIGRQA